MLSVRATSMYGTFIFDRSLILNPGPRSVLDLGIIRF